jgi:hypothetical protein
MTMHPCTRPDRTRPAPAMAPPLPLLAVFGTIFSVLCALSYQVRFTSRPPLQPDCSLIA